MSHSIAGTLQTNDSRFAIVVARFNEGVTRKLHSGAIETFKHHGVRDNQLTTVWVPGSFEIPFVADRLAKGGQFAAVCCLGAVIQGDTTHHEYINHQVSRGIMQAGIESGVPVIFGVLTCQTMELALDRAGGKTGNKGSEAALAAIEMVSLLRNLSEHEI